MLNKITATFEVTTPLFVGGVDPASSVELRAPSIKGVLRFWWRALAWSRLGGDLGIIRSEEARLFGAAGQEGSQAKGAAGQASFLLRVPPVSGLQIMKKGDVLQERRDRIVGPGMRYFGYGLMEAFGQNAGQLVRPCLAAPLQFPIELRSRDPFDSLLIDALKLLGLLGGLGARSRRGYGSLSIISLSGDIEAWSTPKTEEEYARGLREILRPESLLQTEPPYSAFSRLGRIVLAAKGSEPLALLDLVGRQMQRYRSWGHNGKVNGEDSERNFQDDHDWSKSSRKEGYPRRAIFGLPHNYSKMLGVASWEGDRRASPLMVHVHKLSPQNSIAVLSILRAEFLGKDDKIWVWQGQPARPAGDPKAIPQGQLREPQPDWTVLKGFLDGKDKRGRAYFPALSQLAP